jgi:hypothetical protein
MRENLRAIFRSHDIDVVAPTHGRVIRGRQAVDRHLELLLAALTQGEERDERE